MLFSIRGTVLVMLKVAHLSGRKLKPSSSVAVETASRRDCREFAFLAIRTRSSAYASVVMGGAMVLGRATPGVVRS